DSSLPVVGITSPEVELSGVGDTVGQDSSNTDLPPLASIPVIMVGKSQPCALYAASSTSKSAKQITWKSPEASPPQFMHTTVAFVGSSTADSRLHCGQG